MELKLRQGLVVAAHSVLLIVPYGIETAHRQMIFDNLQTFNRTLWN